MIASSIIIVNPSLSKHILDCGLLNDWFVKAATTEEAITGMLGPFQLCPRIG
jgi:hypothetical protein